MRIITILLSLLIITFCSIAQESNKKLNLEDKSFTSQSGVKVEAQAGNLKVPENRSNPKSPEISIYFIKLKSANPNPGTPLIYLEGGPGSSCSWQAEEPYYLEKWLPYLKLGDVILLDQRGTGQGSERVTYIWQDDIPDNLFANVEETKKYFENMQRTAYNSIIERGVDLEGYTSVENATDIDALRKALGYDKISLLGFSYGTHLGQTYIKYFRENLENVILVGTEGLNHTFKLPSTLETQFQKIALLSNADPKINQDVPDLIALYKKVVKKLEANPLQIKVQSPLTRKPMKVTVTPYVLNMIIRFDIGDASDIPVFPRLLYSIDKGDKSMIKWFVQKRIRIVFGVQGMAATMDPASGATAVRQQRIDVEKKQGLFKDIVNFNLGFDWPAPDLGDEFRAPLISNVRTLFMSGTLDFNTPPFQAEEVRWGFSNSSHIIVNNAGHEQVLSHPKASGVVIRFLKGEDVNNVALSYPEIKFIPVKGNTNKDLWHPSMGKRP